MGRVAGGFTVLREKTKIRHEGPAVRRVYREVALRYDGSHPTAEFLMVLDRFLPGLWIEDGHGRELTYLPRRVMETELGSETELIRDADPHSSAASPRALVVILPEPIQTGAALTLRLHYQEDDAAGDWRLFPRRWFTAAKAKQHETHDSFFEIEAPEGSVIALEGGDGMPTPPATDASGVKVHQTLRFVQVRCPGGHKGVGFRYRLRPSGAELAWHRVAFHGLWLVPTAMCLLYLTGLMALSGGSFSAEQGGGPPAPISGSFRGNDAGQVVGTLGVAAVVSIVAFVRPVWTNRPWYLVPLAANALLLGLSLK